ncbi:MAG: sulfate ABC transporter substrate-binding protein [Candidatus Hydrogenedentales bacterium]
MLSKLDTGSAWGRILPLSFFAFFLLCVPLLFSCSNHNDPLRIDLLNVSYDPTRELYRDYNAWFAQAWRKETGQHVAIRQSHGGSGKQARSVIDGLEAHVVTLALAYDIDGIVKKSGLIASDWQNRLPFNSAPYTSTIVFLVRKGNPKSIQDWDDLIRADVEVITANPLTSGGARWAYLAAWGYALDRASGGSFPAPSHAGEALTETEAQAYAFIKRLFQQVPVLDSGARAATTTFLQRNIGDVLLTWENEAFLVLDLEIADGIELVVPSMSILTEPTVAWVDAVTKRRATETVAKAYLDYLYGPEGQRIIANHYFRPRHPEYVEAKHLAHFVDVKLFTLESCFGSWQEAHTRHFSESGLFSSLFSASP